MKITYIQEHLPQLLSGDLIRVRDIPDNIPFYFQSSVWDDEQADYVFNGTPDTSTVYFVEDGNLFELYDEGDSFNLCTIDDYYEAEVVIV